MVAVVKGATGQTINNIEEGFPCGAILGTTRILKRSSESMALDVGLRGMGDLEDRDAFIIVHPIGGHELSQGGITHRKPLKPKVKGERCAFVGKCSPCGRACRRIGGGGACCFDRVDPLGHEKSQVTLGFADLLVEPGRLGRFPDRYLRVDPHQYAVSNVEMSADVGPCEWGRGDHVVDGRVGRCPSRRCSIKSRI